MKAGALIVGLVLASLVGLTLAIVSFVNGTSFLNSSVIYVVTTMALSIAFILILLFSNR